MNFFFCPAGNYEDFASGRVIYGAKGIPNFPVRLIAEIFGRALKASGKKDRLYVYDPCCGGAYSLTIIGFFYGKSIEKMYASDISEDMVLCARRNLKLLTYDGLDERRLELENLYTEHGKDSHLEAIGSADRLRLKLDGEIASEAFVADCTKMLPDIKPDIIITDIPYGNLVDWGGEGEINAMLRKLWEISGDDTILAVSMDKSQKVIYDCWKRIEKQNIGKRRFEILSKNTSVTGGQSLK